MYGFKVGNNVIADLPFNYKTVKAVVTGFKPKLGCITIRLINGRAYNVNPMYLYVV